MPSTFSTRLAVELQANGENLSTWGVKANTGFKLLEEAISGYAAVAISGNTTLTITNGTESSGATDQARNAFLKLTGSPAGAFDLTLPEVAKSWIIWNDTGQTATIQTATATATVSLPDDQLVQVQADGAGTVVQVTPKITSAGALASIPGVFPSITVAGLAYPTADGAAGQFLRTNGGGVLSFATASGAGDLLASANLSDVASIPTARANLGLAAGATAALASQVQAEAGMDNTTLMTPLRAAQAIAALETQVPPQCVQTVKTDTASTASSTFTDLGMSVTITPKSASHKVLVAFNAGLVTTSITNLSIFGVRFRLMRDTTVVGVGDPSGTITRSTMATVLGIQKGGPMSFLYLDSPNTTSAVTYKIQWARSSTITAYFNRNAIDADDRDDRTISTLTALEVS